MPWTLHLANAAGSLDGLVEPITAAVEDARRRAEVVTPAVDLDVVVQTMPGRTIPHLGYAGYTPTGWLVHLTFDPGNPACARSLGEPLGRTVAHELHHALRWRGPGYGRTLGEALVTEGLAGHFAAQLYGPRPERWEMAVDALALRQVAQEADEAWSDGYDHGAWFFGTGDRPMWTGYSLGYALVGRHLKDTLGATAASLHAEAAAAFRPALRSLAADG